VSGARFGEVDLDLLADYVGGALDGTAEADAVAARIAADPDWAHAHTELTTALAIVDAELSALARIDEPMPDDVLARIDAALADPPADDHRPRLTAIAGEGGDSTARRADRRRRWAKWAGGVGVAAGVLAFAGVGLNVLGSSGSVDQATSNSGGSAAAPYRADSSGDGAQRGTAPESATQRMVASGTDYRRDSLPVVAGRQAPLSQSDAAAGGSGAPTTKQAPAAPQPIAELRARAPQPLRRLTDPAALTACLQSITKVYAHPATTVQVVDFASFEGAPALVAVLASTDGQRVAWVAGPDCGTPAAGADTVYTSAVR
jgi:hypothetical protein